MPIATASLNILTFPQHWDGVGLTVRFLCLPQGDPRAPLQPGLLSFADANLQFEARLIGSLDHLPRAADASPVGPLPLDEPPVQKAAFFAELEENQFKIRPEEPPPLVAPPPPTFRKAVTESYRKLVGSRQLSPWLAEAKDYECALHLAREAQPVKPDALLDTIAWGELLAFALRQPKLAMALGLIGQTRVVPADAGFYERGGWLHIGLHASGDLADDPGLVRSFAARIPPLAAGVARDIYAALLFPIDDAGVADEAFDDAERYDRGFARLVHAAQKGGDDGDGIRLAWDDEQIADAFAKQVADNSTRPMGTTGFRVDVQDTEGDGTWHSLQRVASIGPLELGPLIIGPYAGESVVEVVPVQPSPALPGEFWMPPYFCTWRGASLVLTDPDLTRLHQRPGFDPAFDSVRLGREQTFKPVGDKDVPLLYGHSYRFRVRLADLSRGGPVPEAKTPNEPDPNAHHTVEVAFQRHRRPGAIQIVKRPTREKLRIVLAKPQLRHPELLFTGVHNFAEIETALDADIVAKLQREPGLPDPDVLQVLIRLEVRALKGDREEWLELYETTRDFHAATLTLKLDPQDFATLDGLAEMQPGAGKLILPTARDLRLVLTAIGRKDLGYFASDKERDGAPVTLELRATARVEGPLFAAEPQLHSFFFRQPGDDPAVPRPLPRLAQEVGLDARELILTGRAGQRTVFGCANALRHVLSPERSSLTLASDADLSQRWINVLQFELARDWTWDALAEEGLTVQRRLSRPGLAAEVEIAGTISLPRTLTPAILIGVGGSARAPERSFSRVVFVDAVDPKPKPGEFPSELTVSYEIAATLRDELPPPDVAQASALLPITTPPVQVAHLVSAGIALSPHKPADDYSATNQRQRMLWLEFDALPADPKDAYFVRVLASAPDPLLTDDPIAELVPEPALPLDSEWMRLITPGQPRDDNGLRAMQPLVRRSDEGAHFLIPLPDGLDENSPELLNMFTYEVRLGHTEERWSTAQGRFGPPLRIAGVQHPPPPLVCQAARGVNAIHVRAAFATPVQNGRHIRPPIVKTRLWALLYARVEQADAVAWRNLLLLRTPLLPPFVDPQLPPPGDTQPPLLYGEGEFLLAEVQRILRRRGLAEAAPLTALVAEFHTQPEIEDPLGTHLGHARMLRVSPLVPIPDAC